MQMLIRFPAREGAWPIDTAAGFEVLVTEHDDGTVEVAYRSGPTDRWGPPTTDVQR